MEINKMKKTIICFMMFLLCNIFTYAFEPELMDEEFGKVTLTRESTEYFAASHNISVEVHRKAGIPRYGVVRRISGQTITIIDTIYYLPADFERELYNSVIMPYFNRNNIKFYSQNNFRLMLFNVRNGEKVLDNIYRGQPANQFKDAAYVLGRDIAPLDSANSSRELWGMTEIQPLMPMPTSDNLGTVINYDFIHSGQYFLIIVDDVTGYVKYVKTIIKV